MLLCVIAEWTGMAQWLCSQKLMDFPIWQSTYLPSGSAFKKTGDVCSHSSGASKERKDLVGLIAI